MPTMHTDRFATTVLGLCLVACGACASAPEPREPEPEQRTTSQAERPESAAPMSGASCGDRTCGVDEVCVPRGHCSGIRPSTPEEQAAVVYACVPVPHQCAENPNCECVGNVCAYGGCAGIVAGVVQCVCA